MYLKLSHFLVCVNALFLCQMSILFSFLKNSVFMTFPVIEPQVQLSHPQTFSLIKLHILPL